MISDLIKIIVFGANSGYFLYMGASEQNLFYVGIGAVLLFVMIGLVSFAKGYESVWTLLFTFGVTIPVNIKVTEMLLFGMIRKDHPDWFHEIYEPNYTHELFQRGFYNLTGGTAAFMVFAGIMICIMILMTELVVSGMIARMFWPKQKANIIDVLDTEEEEESET